MSAIKFFTLALASSTVASFHAGGHGHRHAARQQPPAYAPPAYGTGAGAAHPTGTGSPYPYPIANGTGVWGSTGISKPSAPAGYGSSSAAEPQPNTDYSTLWSTHYKTVTVENQQAPSSAPAPSGNEVSPAGYGSGSGSGGSPSGGAGGEDDEQCKPVTVTHTEKVTMTLTEGQTAPSSTNASPAETSSAAAPPAYSAPSSSSEASPAQSSAPSAPPAYSAPAPSTNEASPAQSSAPSAPVYPVASSSSEASPAQSSAPSAPPAYSAPASSSSEASPATTSAAPALSAYGDVKQVAPKSSAASSASSPSSTGSSGSGSGSGKRGLAYNDASLTKCFEGSREITWAYNWGSSSDGLSSDFMFVPTLWGDGTEFTSKWSKNAQAAIDSGSSHLFSFNEPDHDAQANMACGTAAAAYKQYMNPFKGKAQLCAPSVTNGGGQMGLTWLKDFLSQCTDCQIDCLNIHWYDSASNVEYFKKHIQDAAALAPGKPIYVSEFGATGSDEEISQFLQEVMPWMDSNSDVAGYAYFMTASGQLVTGTEPSTYGKTYMSYTG
ncbi:Alkali-sensitive linkage protein 1 [Cercospora beticola]|uniref:Alkali-sensitive linkage protein 1 n=1 Tax=Cercospora beticola TaxID=122368 RepID=A0A2G5HUD5_CERBT|nr:Alkali-sensitive linkage protein 1 [Cercospora beticola]PIA96157.1 Alkali-sensitive linkage protein 1 [Cercospora beticola]WPB07033.1 hypothetical protein RHO25_011693 [Cercospora beticola]